MGSVKPAFNLYGGSRTVAFVMDVGSNDRVPAIAEPLLNMGAKVEFHPAKTLESLRKRSEHAKVGAVILPPFFYPKRVGRGPVKSGSPPHPPVVKSRGLSAA